MFVDIELSVGNRFGGETVRKVLFAKGGASLTMHKRADEMNNIMGIIDM